jgi:hypothetical protein
MGSHYVAKAGLELSTLLPLLPRGWHQRCEAPQSALIPFLIRNLVFLTTCIDRIAEYIISDLFFHLPIHSTYFVRAFCFKRTEFTGSCNGGPEGSHAFSCDGYIPQNYIQN